jgi:hypothetical protein
MTAMSLGRTQTALGAFYRRLAARIGKPQAITATARKLAVLVYRALKGELVYRDPGADAYDLQQRARALRRLRQRASTLGFDLLNRETGQILQAGVSWSERSVSWEVYLGHKGQTVFPLEWTDPGLRSLGHLTPDLVLRRRDELHVFDAKYKAHFAELDEAGGQRMADDVHDSHRAVHHVSQ